MTAARVPRTLRRMAHEQELFVALIVLYLFECVLVVRRDVLILRSIGMGGFRVVRAGDLPGSPERALFLAMPVPPLGAFYLTQSRPVSLSPDGLSTRRAEHLGCESESLEPAEFIAYPDVRSVSSVSKDVQVNERIIAHLCSPAAAQRLAGEIERLRAAPDRAAREQRLTEFLDELFGIDAAREQRVRSEREAKTLLWLCNALCIYLFAITPLIVWRSGLSGTWVMLLIGLLGLWVGVVAEFVRVHRRLDPDASADRRQRFVILCCTPLAAARAYDLLLRDRLLAWHPLCGAAASCSAEEIRQLAGAMLRDLVFPCRAADERAVPEAESCAAWQRKQLYERVRALLPQFGVSELAATALPPADGPDSVACCPRCHTQFVREVDTCPHCPGVVVHPLIPPESYRL